MENEQVIEVYIKGFDEGRWLYIGEHEGNEIEIDPFVTELFEDYNDKFKGNMQLTGEWDEDCFMTDGFKRLG